MFVCVCVYRYNSFAPYISHIYAIHMPYMSHICPIYVPYMSHICPIYVQMEDLRRKLLQFISVQPTVVRGPVLLLERLRGLARVPNLSQYVPYISKWLQSVSPPPVGYSAPRHQRMRRVVIHTHTHNTHTYTQDGVGCRVVIHTHTHTYSGWRRL